MPLAGDHSSWIKFLIDECLTPHLAVVANERGYEAYHVAHRGWSGIRDSHLVTRAIDGDFVLVTNNGEDIVSLLAEVELHPGLVVILDNVRRADQKQLFSRALDVLDEISSMTNMVIDVASNGSVTLYDLPTK